MSGGSYDYMYSRVEDTYGDKMFDLELNAMIWDFAKVLKAVEWWQSGDYSEETYREEVKAFKNKYFKKTGRRENLENILLEEIARIRVQLLQDLD